MGQARMPLVAALVGPWLVAGGALAAEAAGGGPSIEEMLSAVEEKAGPAAPEASRPAAAEGRAKAAPKLSTDVAAGMKKIQARAAERLAFFRKDQRGWQAVELYVRLEKFTEAAQTLAPILRSRNPGRSITGYVRSRMDRLGEFELEYACLMTYLGKTETAAAMLKAYKEKFDANFAELLAAEWVSRYWIRRWHEPRVAFVEGYAKNGAKVDVIEAALAEKPDAKMQWELVKLCDPENNRACLALKYFTAVVDLVSAHPDNPHVKSGAFCWELDEAYRCHELFEDAIRLIESMPERFPENDKVKNGMWLFLLGGRYFDLGRMREEMRDRRAGLDAYRRSLAAYERMRKEHPEHSYCKVQADGDPPTLNTYVNYTLAGIRRTGGR